MTYSYYKKFLVLQIWAIFTCPYSIANCNLNMQGIEYFINVNQEYKVKIKVESLCAKRAIYKRNLKNIQLSIYKNKQLLETNTFKSGLWMPSQKRFFLKYDTPPQKYCFKGAKTLMMDFNKKVINSINGHFLNMETGTNLGLDCKI